MALLLTLALPLGAIAQEELAVEQAREPSAAQQLRVPRTARAQIPANPEAYIHRKQENLRNHHLVKTPEIRFAPRVAGLPPLRPEAETRVAPLDESPIEILVNHALDDGETGGLTSTVGEPSVAASADDHVLMTGNWYAAFSDDGGATFDFVNPETTFPSTASHRFCCDQVAIYSAEHDLMMWFLQYTADDHSNIVRLAVSSGADIGNRNWQYYDFSPQSIGGWNDEWFDFPDLAISGEYLYISTNSFTTQGDQFARAVVLRIPLGSLANYDQVTSDYFQSEEAFSLRPTHGATEGTMHFGSHDFANFGGRILVYSWSEDDGSDSIAITPVDVDPWSNEPRESDGPDGRPWLNRTDFRMTGAWADGKLAGFTWSAAQDNSFEHPHARVAVIDMESGQLVAQPHLWSADYAYAYPYMSPSAADGATIGVSVAYGGGGDDGFHPSHAVGVLRRTGQDQFEWQLTTAHNGTDGPEGGRWGDYLAVRPHGAGDSWVATGFTLEGGAAPENVVPRFVRFRASGPPPPKTDLKRNLVEIRNQLDGVIQRLGADSNDEQAPEPETDGEPEPTKEPRRSRPRDPQPRPPATPESSRR